MVSQVKKETMRACLSCPICHSILLDATTISECLHTFCRKCIYEKVIEDEIEGCPVCNIDLGGTPLDKLRPDHNLQDLRTKIFPLKGRKVKAPEPASRKQRSMSSLVVTKPKVSDQATKTVTRKGLRESASLAEKEEESLKGGDLLESTSSPGTLDQNQKQVNKDGSDEPWGDESYWKTLNFLVEVANRTNTLKPSAASQGSGSRSEEATAASHKRIQPEVKEDRKSKCRREYEKSDNGVCDHTTSETRLPRTQRKRRSTTFGDLRNAIQPDESSAKRERRNGPVWFSLVASTDLEGKASLPQIPAIFLRIRDGDIPVSFIQKYLMRKLDLHNEAEVEIRCMGKAVTPTLKLQKLVDLWLQRCSKRRRVTWTGSSAKDYLMVLVYGRKLLDSNN